MLVLAAGLVGCGGDDEEQQGAPIPQQAASDIESRLAEVERRMEAGGGACADIENDTKPAVEQIVASLPSDVDPDVRDALDQSVDRLFQLTADQCDEQKGQETEEEPPVTIETEPETDTETTETVPPETETETVPPETDTDEQLPPDQEELPPGQDGGNSNGTGGGDGGGGLFAPEDLE
jgi:hypothetical protein